MNCKKLGMEPVFIVSRIFATAAKELEDAGATVIETGVQFYQKENWPLAWNLRDHLGYHFVRRVAFGLGYGIMVFLSVNLSE